jgi:hypothetical protein
LRDGAIARIEDYGHRNSADYELSRAAERILHATGATDAAYRVEASRQAADRNIHAVGRSPGPRRIANVAGLTVSLAGGHPALRAMARRDLIGAGVRDVKEIPPTWEATKDERAVQATMAGSDLAIIITRQISHSTSDQVRKAAARLGLPVVNADSASVSAIRRSVERHAVSHAKRQQ